MGSLGKIQLYIRRRGGEVLSLEDDRNIATHIGEAAGSKWSLLAAEAALPR